MHTWPYDHVPINEIQKEVMHRNPRKTVLQGVDLTVRHLSVHLLVLLQAGKVDKKVGAITGQHDFKVEAMCCDGGIANSLHPVLVCLYLDFYF